MVEARIVITGIGVVSPLGLGVSAFWEALTLGRSAIGEIRSFDPGPKGPRLGAEVPELPAREFLPAALVRRMDRLSRMIAVASAMAVTDARLTPSSGRSGEDFGVVVGSALGNLSESAQFLERVFTKGPALASPMIFPNLVLNAPASQVAMAFGWQGPNLSVSAGEVSGEAALESAVGLLRRGRAKAIIAAAGDEISRVVFAALRDFRRLSPRGHGREWSSPFDRGANGAVMGEGASALVLESEAEADRRGARGYAVLSRMENLVLPTNSPYDWPLPGTTLDLAKDDPPDVLFSGADSSPERDLLELRLLSPMARMTGAPLFSPKGAIGDHGSVGLTNVAAAALCLSSGTVPPMPSLEQPREEYPFTYPREPLRGPRRRALILGVARGGATPTVILDAWR